MREFLSFSISSRKIIFGIVTETGSVISSTEIDYDHRLEGKEIISNIIDITRKCNSTVLSGITISTAGQVDSNSGVILYASDHILKYTGVKVKQLLEEALDLPVEVQNDVNASALAESWIGVAKDVQSLFYMSIGMGIGGSYIIDNKLHAGHSYSAGEIGYLPFDGQHLEDVGSMQALKLRVAARLSLSVEDISVPMMIEKYNNGDAIVIEEMDYFIKIIGFALTSIVYMLNPELIVIGGDVKHHRAFFLPKFRASLEQNLLPNFQKNVQLEIADEIKQTRLIGAVRNYLLQESSLPLRNFLSLLEQKKPMLTKTELLIAHFIVNNLERVPLMTITEMAKQVNVSDPTVTRFCRKIDLASYNELKMVVKMAQATEKIYERSTGNTEIRSSYEHTMASIDTELKNHRFQKIIEEISSVRTFYFFSDYTNQETLLKIKTLFLKKGILFQSFSMNEAIEYSDITINAKIPVCLFLIKKYDTQAKKQLNVLLEQNPNVLTLSETDVAKEKDLALFLPTTSANHEFALYYFFESFTEKINSK